jgi:predicted XRE-type DNA-binding protein
MKNELTPRIQRSSGNVFCDLGFSAAEAEHLLIRSDLLIRLQQAITSRGLKQAELPGSFVSASLASVTCCGDG